MSNEEASTWAKQGSTFMGLLLVGFMRCQSWLQDSRTWLQMPVVKMAHPKNRPRGEQLTLLPYCPHLHGEAWCSWLAESPRHMAGTVTGKACLPCGHMALVNENGAAKRVGTSWDRGQVPPSLVCLPPKSSPCLAPTSTV